jgi:hypothetical protein
VDRNDAKLLLGEYVQGQLSADQAAAVQMHLAEDETLRRMDVFLRWVQPCLVEIKDHLPGDHPTGAELVDAVLGQDGFPNQRGDWVRSHLADCEECRGLQTAIEEANDQLEREDSPRVNPKPQWAKWAVAAVLALAIFATGIWLGTRNDQLDGQPILAAIHLTGITRGESSSVEIRPSIKGLLPPVLLEHDPWVGRSSGDDFQMDISLLEAQSLKKVKVWRLWAMQTWSEKAGGILLDLGDENLAAGEYLFEVADDTGTITFQTGFHLLPQ